MLHTLLDLLQELSVHVKSQVTCTYIHYTQLVTFTCVKSIILVTSCMYSAVIMS